MVNEVTIMTPTPEHLLIRLCQIVSSGLLGLNSYNKSAKFVVYLYLKMCNWG